MDQNIDTKLDVEFKRHLQILRPYLLQLMDQDVIDICNAWIQKLSDCKENEKGLRNKYIFALCYQVAKGVLDEPFLQFPPLKELPLLNDDVSSEGSFSEVECLVINSESANTKILYDKKHVSSKTDSSCINKETSCVDSKIDLNSAHRESSKHITEASEKPCNYTFLNENVTRCNECEESYYFRANNLISKLREMKNQNILLQNELAILRQECKMKGEIEDTLDDSVLKIDNATITYINNHDSNTALTSLKSKLKEVQTSRNNLITTVGSLQEKLDNLVELKNHEIGELEAEHKLNIIKLRTSIREELQVSYENKLDALRKEYEDVILTMERNMTEKIDNLCKSKDKIIFEKEQLLQSKEDDIRVFKCQLEELKSQQYCVLNINKLIDSSNENSSESVSRSRDLEKRLYKMEKSNDKCIRAYEAKIASLQREKHMIECSLQLQLIKQRAQVVTEVTDENQMELKTAIDNLENKYKQIVANMQATAVQRRLQDQIALESLIQAIQNKNANATNKQYSAKTVRNLSEDGNKTGDRETETVCTSNRVDNHMVGNKSFGEDSVVTGYCLDSEKLKELFERVQIPQRDVANISK